jgi:hypothetical protein
MLQRDEILDACKSHMPQLNKLDLIKAINDPKGGLSGTKQFTNYHAQNQRLKIQQLILLGASILPVLFYQRIPFLRDNATIGVRIVLSASILCVPSIIYNKWLKK